MDSELPKQFIDVKGLPIVIHTYNKVKDLENTKFIFVLPFDNFSKWEMLIRHEFILEENEYVCGYET